MRKIHDFQSKLLKRTQLTDTTFEFKYELPLDFEWLPGQFVGARVIPTHTRAYSIVEAKYGVLTLIVDIKPGGIASKYFEKVQEGEMTRILGPYGIYGRNLLAEGNLNTKVFISTGSGIAPFIPMVKAALRNSAESKVYNFFGARYEKDDYARNYFQDVLSEFSSRFEYYSCITREGPLQPHTRQGRVTQVVPLFDFDYPNTEFYICGSSEMISDMKEILVRKGATKIFTEKYD